MSARLAVFLVTLGAIVGCNRGAKDPASPVSPRRARLHGDDDGDRGPKTTPPSTHRDSVETGDDGDERAQAPTDSRPVELELDPPRVKAPADGEARTRPGEGVRCGQMRCKPGEDCLEFVGIAGAAGPRLRECGIRCRRGQPNDGCPVSSRCVHIADGPGPVCRPR